MIRKKWSEAVEGPMRALGMFSTQTVSLVIHNFEKIFLS